MKRKHLVLAILGILVLVAIVAVIVYAPAITKAATAKPTATTVVKETVVAAMPTETVQQPTTVPSATANVASMDIANPCRDGEVLGNDRNSLNRSPVGLAENVVVSEVAWSGPGFGNFQRAVLVVPQLGNYQVFLLKVDTIHSLRYCGTLSEVQTYVSDKNTHVWAMRATAADGSGNLPDEQEIGVYNLDLVSGKLSVLVPAPKGPSLTDVQGHIEVVRLASSSVSVATPAPKSTPVTAATPTVQAKAPVVAKCVPTTMDLGPWEAKDRTVQGPAVVNIGWPKEGNAQVRTFVPAGKTVVFLSAAGSGWSYSVCGEDQAQAELTANAGNIKVITVDELIAQSNAKWQ